MNQIKIINSVFVGSVLYAKDDLVTASTIEIETYLVGKGFAKYDPALVKSVLDTDPNLTQLEGDSLYAVKTHTHDTAAKNNNYGEIQVWGGGSASSFSTNGALSALATGPVTRVNDITNWYKSFRRAGFTTAIAAGSSAGVVTPSDFKPLWISQVNNLGFNIKFKFGMQKFLVSKTRFIIGCSDAIALVNNEPSLYGVDGYRIMGVGADSTDTNLQFIVSAATTLKIDLGVNFPINTDETEIYDCEIKTTGNSLNVYVKVTRLSTGHIYEATLLVPEIRGVKFGAHISTNNKDLADTTGLDVMAYRHETEY